MAVYKIALETIQDFFRNTDSTIIGIQECGGLGANYTHDVDDLIKYRSHLNRLEVLMKFCRTTYVSLDEGEVLMLRNLEGISERLARKLEEKDVK